jgi:hypothetical protein
LAVSAKREFKARLFKSWAFARLIEVLMSQGKTVLRACTESGIIEQTLVPELRSVVKS